MSRQGCTCCSVSGPPRKATPASACLETITTESYQVDPHTRPGPEGHLSCDLWLFILSSVLLQRCSTLSHFLSIGCILLNCHRSDRKLNSSSSPCDLPRLGALHGTLALLPVLAAAGRRPSPPSPPEDGDSCQTQTGCKHHFCPAGLVFQSHTVIHESVSSAVFILKLPLECSFLKYSILLMSSIFALLLYFQNNTPPPRARGWLTTVRRRSSPPRPQPHCLGWVHPLTPPTLDTVSSGYNSDQRS